jgi:hypothetical protein
MKWAAILGLGSVGLLVLLSAGGCQRSDAVNENLLQLDEGTFEVTGPYVHENVAVFLLQSNEQDERDFITLDQGLKDGVVKVSEQGRAQVQQLEIDNQSDHYLFLQEGDRVVGGQQDRIIVTSLVIPPNSGKMPLPSFCVEAGRWQGARAFHGSANAALAPKEVRQASKVANEQGRVWESVRGVKNSANSCPTLNAPNTNTSLTETLESPQVKQVSDECAAALRNILDDNPKALGVAIAVNGVIEEVNVYPNHQVLDNLYPRLLQSYALQAAMVKDKASEDKALAVADIRSFMTERKEQAEASKRDVNRDNTLMVCPSEKQVECQTVYAGKVVHRQWLSKGEAAAKQAPPATQGRQMLAPNPAPSQAENGPERQQPRRQQPQEPQSQQPKN